MNHYIKGMLIEYKVRKELEKEGYTCTRSSSSKGPWDITAVSKDKVLLIQVKSIRDKKRSYTDEIRALRELKVPKSVSKELWIWLKQRGWKKMNF